jgi:hypothetical protein
LEAGDLLNRPVSLISSGILTALSVQLRDTRAKSAPRNFSLTVLPFQSLVRLSSSFWESDPERGFQLLTLTFPSAHFLKLLIKGLLATGYIAH